MVFGEMVNGPGGYFGSSLQSFDDCLFGGYGLETPCEIRWVDSDASRISLGAECLASWARERLDQREYLDEEGRRWLVDTIQQAEAGTRTMFEEIVDGIRSVEERGGQRIDLVLE